MSNASIMRSFLLALVQCVLVQAHDLTVDLHPQKLVVDVGEPVVVSATVANNEPDAMTLIHHNAPTLYHGLSVIDLRFGADKEHLMRWDDWLRPTRRTGARLIQPQESITVDLVMLFSAKDGFFATEPGKYWIQGRAYSNGDILGPPVPIEIRELSPADKPMWEWLNAHKEEYGRLVQIPWEAKLSDEFLKGCDDACTKTPSVYTEYIALFLSRWYQEGPGKERENAKEQPARYAEIAKARATSDKIRTEAEKVLARAQPEPPADQK